MRAWLDRRVHISWVIAGVGAGFLTGVGVAPVVASAIFAEGWWLIAAATLLLVVLIKKRRAFLSCAIVAGLIIGVWRGALELHDLGAYQPYYGTQVVVVGVVSEDVVAIDGEQRIRVSDVAIADRALRGTLWVSTSSKTDGIKRGDKLRIEGTLLEGFGNFPAAMFRAKIAAIERPHPGDEARQLRDWFADNARRAIEEPQASLGIGFLTGQQSTLPESLDTQLQLLGLTHIVVASGYNLTILVRLARRAFARRSKYLATVAAGGLTAGFVLVTGFSASMNRAALVTGLSLAAWYYGRRVHPVVLLLLAASITVMASPSVLWGDVGWYLSFASFAGVIILAPLVHHYFWDDAKPGFLRQILVDTSAAQIATLPIVIFIFGQYSPLALIANLLILPLVPLAMLLTFLAGIAAAIAPGFAEISGGPAMLILGYMTQVVDWLSRAPFAQADVDATVGVLVGGYGLILFAGFWLWYKTKHDFRNENGAI